MQIRRVNMRKIYLYLIAFFFTASFLMVPASHSAITTNVTITNSGIIQSLATTTFQIHGADVNLDIFFPGNINYQPNAWQMLRDLNINLIRCLPGMSGNVMHFSLNYDTNWAQNLNNFLTTANSNGIKVIFYEMGSRYGNNLLLGIIPYAYGTSSYPYTSIADAKTMIDKLAGNNALGINFISDPRIYAWSTSNENDLSDAASLNWNLQLCDYIRSKGGKAEISFPIWGSWDIDPITTGNTLYGHVDLIEYHMYGEYEYVNYFARDTRSYGQWSNCSQYIKYLFQQMLSTPHFSANQIFIGEYGCWLGTGSNEGLNGVTFTAQDRINLYSDTLNAARETGIKNLCLHNLVSGQGESPDYGIYKPTNYGTGIYWDTNLANLIRTAYGS
jgi:hypothetical protein